MTFAALAPWQAVAFIAAALALAWWLFRLKVRPRRMQVPSLIIWRHVFELRRDESWWERFRRAVSLAATLVVALLLALAFVRPGFGTAAAAASRRLIVLDTSWSMRAETSDGGTRWTRAVSEARTLIRTSAGAPVTLATTAEGVVEGPTTDVALIETALDRLEPTGAGEAWPGAVEGETIHFITDGVSGPEPGSGVVVHSVYDPVPNLAITAFDVRPAPSAAAHAAVYLEVANYSDEPRDVRVTVTRGTAVLLDAPVRLAAGELDREVLDLAPSGDARLIAHVTTDGSDALPDDDEAVAWIGDAEALDVAVVSTGGSLAALLQRFSGIRTTVVGPRDPVPAAADVVVYDGGAPPRPPDRPVLLVGATPAVWLGRPGAEERDPRWVTSDAHPLLRGVDPLTIDIARAGGLTGDRLTTIASSERGTPLAMIMDEPRLRLVALTFGLADSNLASAPAFPVLVGNALEWLARPSLPTPVGPGAITLPAGVLRVLAPDGEEVPFVRAGDEVQTVLPVPGLYRIDVAGARSVVAVNAGDPVRSNLQRTGFTAGDGVAREAADGTGRPWWPYALMAVIGLIALEWLTWLRRITV